MGYNDESYESPLKRIRGYERMGTSGAIKRFAESARPVNDDDIFSSVTVVTEPTIKTNHTERWLREHPEFLDIKRKSTTQEEPMSEKERRQRIERFSKSFDEWPKQKFSSKRSKRKDEPPAKVGFFKKLFGSNTRYL